MMMFFVVETTPGWGKSMSVNTLLQASYMRHWHVAIDGIAELRVTKLMLLFKIVDDEDDIDTVLLS